MSALASLATLVVLALVVVLVLTAVFGRRPTREAAYAVLALLLGPGGTRKR